MNYVYIVHRVVPYEGGTDLAVKNNLRAAKRAAQDHSDQCSREWDQTPRKVRWRPSSYAKNCWLGDDDRYDSYAITKWKVESQ